MKVLIESNSEKLHEELKVDSRGRITLGSEYAGETLSVAIVDRED